LAYLDYKPTLRQSEGQFKLSNYLSHASLLIMVSAPA
jgi:hypothetical protein